jgi:tetratricopeptide (TPR) repeat protein
MIGRLVIPCMLAALCAIGQAPIALACTPTTQADAASGVRQCPSQDETDAALAAASALIGQSKYKDVEAALGSEAEQRCDPRATLLLAAALEAEGDIAGAARTLETAHAAWPANNSISTSLARAYLNAGETEKAVAALDRFHATPSTAPQEMQLAVVVYLAAHHLEPARTVAEVAYKAQPSLQSLLLLANVLQLQGRFKEALTLLRARQKEFAGSAPFLITLAESEYDAVLYDSARADLERAIQLNQESYQAHLLLGNVEMKLTRVDQAIEEYRAAARLAPAQPRTYYQLALALTAKRDQAGAEKALQQSLAADAHFAPAHVEMGRILISERRTQDAVLQLDMAIEDNPSTEQAYFLLARAYALMGETEKSEAMAKRLVEVRNANSRTVEKEPASASGAASPR